ncbi:MAG: hypothetical protein ABSA52_16955 [Candidatus Binatia bacterium]
MRLREHTQLGFELLRHGPQLRLGGVHVALGGARVGLAEKLRHRLLALAHGGGHHPSPVANLVEGVAWDADAIAETMQVTQFSAVDQRAAARAREHQLVAGSEQRLDRMARKIGQRLQPLALRGAAILAGRQKTRRSRRIQQHLGRSQPCGPNEARPGL